MRILQLVLALVLLAGCGGGSDGAGKDTGGGTGGGPTLAITGDNALYIAAVTSLSNDTLVGLSQLAVLAHDELNNKPRTSTAATPVFCQNGPQASQLQMHTVSDSHYLGPDHRFSIVFEQCQLAELEATVTGELEVLIQSVTLDSYSLEISASKYQLTSRNLQLQDEEGVIQVAVDLNSSYAAENYRYSFLLTPASQPLALTLPDNTLEQWAGFRTQLTLDSLSGRYALSTSGVLQSGQLAGSISVTTIQPLSGRFQRLPSDGELKFQGAGTSTMRLSSIETNDGYLARVTLPELGLEGDADWLELSTGVAWQKTGLAKNYRFRPFREFVNLEREWFAGAQTMTLRLLPNQAITLHFSDVVKTLGGSSSDMTLTAVDDKGLRISSVPEIDVEYQLLGTVVQLQPTKPLLAGYRYFLGPVVGYNSSSQQAFSPVIYAQLNDELSATINLSSVLLSQGQKLEVYPDIQSDLELELVEWQTDDTVVQRFDLPENGLELHMATAPAGGFLKGRIALNLLNARGNQFTTELPYAIIDAQLTDYFFNSVEPLSGVGSASALVAPIETDTDAGNDTGIYTGISGMYREVVGDTTTIKIWGLSLRTGRGGLLDPGSYTAGSENDLNAPHIRVYVEGRSCDTESATFNVEQAEYDAEQIFVKALRADYSLICKDNQQRYQYRGQIRYQRGF